MWYSSLSITDQIYDSKLTVIPRLLVEQEEVKADDVGVLCRVRFGKDAAEDDNMDYDG